jgi:hypothetical protein
MPSATRPGSADAGAAIGSHDPLPGCLFPATRSTRHALAGAPGKATGDTTDWPVAFNPPTGEPGHGCCLPRQTYPRLFV